VSDKVSSGFDVRQFSSDKILKHLDRVNAWLKGGNPFPVTVELDMTNACNHRCPECSGWYFQNKGGDSLPLGLAEDIIRQIAKAGIRGIIFTGGGDPLCHPGIKHAVKLAHGLGLDIGFITNGSLLNREISALLLRSCRWIRISLDAASSGTFRKIHGMDGDVFDKLLDNIKMLVRIKKDIKSRAVIGIGYLTSIHTKKEMTAAAVLCGKMGVDYLQFRPLQVHNNGRFEYHRAAGIEKEILKCLSYSRPGYDILYSKHKYDMMKEKDFGRNYGKCYGQQFAAVIAADAKMYICCHMRGYAKYCIGNLKKDPLEKIWNSGRRKKVIENINFRDCVPLCRDNTFNQILWNIKQPREHINFL
jgi:MoaA/NifB/PqqE/SkfB family radical SAM enzyme